VTVAGPRRAAGFTLVEVLVAMVIMAIMSLIAWQGVDGIVRTRESNQVRLEQTLRLETVIAQWEQDLAALQESAAVPAISCDGQSVRLTRRAEGGVQVVAWSLRPDATNSIWQRWASQAVTTTTACRRTGCARISSRATSPVSCAPSAGSSSGRSISSRATPGATASRLGMCWRRTCPVPGRSGRRCPPACASCCRSGRAAA
jgi:general secretion pathway protein J